jgi:hypothetical protein
VQFRRRLIQDVERPARPPLREFAGELHPLRLLAESVVGGCRKEITGSIQNKNANLCS